MFDRRDYRVFWLGGLILVLAGSAAANMEGQNIKTTESQSAEGDGVVKEIQSDWATDVARFC